jgi:hypothetical protein
MTRGKGPHHCHLRLMIYNRVAKSCTGGSLQYLQDGYLWCVRGSLRQRIINNTVILRNLRQDSLDYCDGVHDHLRNPHLTDVGGGDLCGSLTQSLVLF